MKEYVISMEISGSTAMWTRPDTGDCPVSYPVPTYSACKGIFKSVLWGPAVEVIPLKVEICSPIVYHEYHTNYGGPLRSSGQIKTGSSFQLLATVLIDVVYRLYAKAVPVSRALKSKIPAKASEWDGKTTSPGHAYASIFNRRLKRGQCFSIPCLGWKEFGPDYFGHLKETTKPRKEINMTIPSMLRDVFPDGYGSGLRYVYDQNVSVKEGVMLFSDTEAANAQ